MMMGSYLWRNPLRGLRCWNKSLAVPSLRGFSRWPVKAKQSPESASMQIHRNAWKTNNSISQLIVLASERSFAVLPIEICRLYVEAVSVRRITWIATVALGSVITYSAVAAIHALVFVVVRKEMVSQYMLKILWCCSGERYNIKWSTWLPVLPMAWDNDVDPILTVVGAAFLVLLPMQMWSQTLRETKPKSILVLWSFLLFIGMICASVAQAYVTFYSFPQLRFCPPNRHELLPLINNGAHNVGTG